MTLVPSARMMRCTCADADPARRSARVATAERMKIIVAHRSVHRIMCRAGVEVRRQRAEGRSDLRALSIFGTALALNNRRRRLRRTLVLADHFCLLPSAF